MAPDRSRLNVCPRVPTLIGFAAVALLVAVAVARPAPAAPARRLSERSTFSRPPAEKPTAGTASTSPAKSEHAAAPPQAPAVAQAAAPAVPAALEEDVRLLQDWILNLPPEELRAFDASGALNRRISRIVAEAAGRGEEGLREFDRFVAALNVRLGVVPP